LFSYFFSNRITRPLIQLTEAAGNISQGNTDVDIDIHTRDEVGTLCKSFKNMVSNIRKSFDTQINSIANTSKTLTSSSNEMSAAILEQVGIAADQSTSISEISATLKQLATTSSQIAENSTLVVDTSSTAVTYSENGVQALESLKDRMDDITRDNEGNLMEIMELGRKSQEIGSVMEIISHIADQTKLIAFNAAIEAASAGETGKRFGVVAVEIRNLADNVMKSTLNIESRIEEVQASINKLVVSSENGTKKIKTVNGLAAQTLNQFEGLVNGARSANDAATTISFFTQQQEFATSQVFEALKEIEQGIHHYSSSTQQTNGISQGLLLLAEELNRLIEGLQDGSQNTNGSKQELQETQSS
jgi:methyl-accepting chemotaxis protein